MRRRARSGLLPAAAASFTNLHRRPPFEKERRARARGIFLSTERFLGGNRGTRWLGDEEGKNGTEGRPPRSSLLLSSFSFAKERERGPLPLSLFFSAQSRGFAVRLLELPPLSRERFPPLSSLPLSLYLSLRPFGGRRRRRRNG
jgi:hypothetical protein